MSQLYIGYELVQLKKNRQYLHLYQLSTISHLYSKHVHLIHHLVPYGFRIVESPHIIPFYRLSIRALNNITTRTSDHSGELFDCRGKDLTLRIHLRGKI